MATMKLAEAARLAAKVLLLWTVETVLNALASAALSYQGTDNHDSLLTNFWGALLVYASLKAAFHLPLYLLAYFTILREVLLGKSVAELLGCHLILFSGVSFVVGTVFAWNMFYNSFQLVGLLLVSSALAVLPTSRLLPRR